MKSEKGKLNGKDLFRGALMAVGTAVGTSIIPLLQSGTISKQQLILVVGAGLAAGISYLVKNLNTNSNDELGKPEPK